VTVHVVRLRGDTCGTRVGWVDRRAGGLVLVTTHHVAASKYKTSDTAWPLDDLTGPVVWDCPAVRCQRQLVVTAVEAARWAAMAAPGKVRDVRVPHQRQAHR